MNVIMFPCQKNKNFLYNVKDSRLWQVIVLFFSVFSYILAVVSSTWWWVNALVVLVIWILIMVYFCNISKSLSATPCLLVILRLIMMNLPILKKVRIKWCSHHLHWLWKDIRKVGHVFLKCFHKTAKLLFL